MASTSRPPGRPHKITPDLLEHLAELLAAGNPLDTSARSAGISPATLHRWQARGQTAADLEAEEKPVPAAELPYLELWHAVTTSRARAEVEALGIIRAAALSGTWQAAAWLLERRRPDLWSRHRDRPEEEPTTSPAVDHRQRLREMLGLSEELGELN